MQYDATLVTIAEAGRRLGLRNLADYKQKVPGFPDPVRTERPLLWDYEEVAQWYSKHITARPELRKEQA